MVKQTEQTEQTKQLSKEALRKQLQTHRMGAHIVKELAECGLFVFFSSKAMMAYLDSSCLHYILFPLLGIGLTADFVVEVQDFRHNENKNVAAVSSLVLTGVIALLTDIVVVGNVTYGPIAFTTGPYLFLGVLAAMVIRNAAWLVNDIKEYRCATDENEKKGYAQSMAFRSIGMVGAVLGIIFVVGIMIFPVGPGLAMGISMVGLAFTLGLVAWKVAGPSCRRQVKACFSVFKKSNYNEGPSLGQPKVPAADNEDYKRVDNSSPQLGFI